MPWPFRGFSKTLSLSLSFFNAVVLQEFFKNSLFFLFLMPWCFRKFSKTLSLSVSFFFLMPWPFRRFSKYFSLFAYFSFLSLISFCFLSTSVFFFRYRFHFIRPSLLSFCGSVSKFRPPPHPLPNLAGLKNIIIIIIILTSANKRNADIFQLDMVTREVHPTQDIVFSDLTVCPWILSGFEGLAVIRSITADHTAVSQRSSSSSFDSHPFYSPPPSPCFGHPFCIKQTKKSITKSKQGTQQKEHKTRFKDEGLA